MISRNDLINMNVVNLIETFQKISGIDVRQRGVNGTQADLYIRGGTFDQTLLLVDGFKLDDPQTGHHSLNLIIPIQLIERVEVIKGSSSKSYSGKMHLQEQLILSPLIQLNLRVKLNF